MEIIMRYEDVKELIEIFEKTDLNDMEVHLDNAIVRLNRGKSVPMAPVSNGAAVYNVANQPADAQESSVVTVDSAASVNNTAYEGGSESSSSEEQKYIKAPIVGTFYQSASPEKPPYVNVGDKVSKGDVVCIIEAMKFMNEVTSEENGKIVEILVEDGEFVEYGAPLFRIE